MIRLDTFIRKNIDLESDDPFTLFDVEDVIIKIRKWLKILPRVIPYYAVKANRFPLLLDIMIELGLRFDCASQFEMNEILRRGGKPNDIIFANPCKTKTFLNYSKNNGIDLMTFDNEEELVKIEAIYPEARLLLRIKVDDRHSNIKLSPKFGRSIETVGALLMSAKKLNLNVVGVAFHVGSGCSSSFSYVSAIQKSRFVFDLAMDMGFNMQILNIGGGFPGSNNTYINNKSKFLPTIEEMAFYINGSLNQYYPENNLTIIGEPGRYFCESAFTSITKIIAKNIIIANDEKNMGYYLNDGIFGSFRVGAVEGRIYKPLPFLKNEEMKLRKEYLTIIWGPTCASDDLIRRNFKMPELKVDEWILFENMGAYLQNYSEFGFNGMPNPKIKIFISEIAKKHLENTKIWKRIEAYLD